MQAINLAVSAILCTFQGLQLQETSLYLKYTLWLDGVHSDKEVYSNTDGQKKCIVELYVLKYMLN